MRRALLALGSLVLAIIGAWRWLTRRTARPGPADALPGASLPSLGRLLLVALPALGLAGAVFFVAVGAPWLLARQIYPLQPGQPIAFNHQLHVESAGLDCAFCHRTANVADSAGFPDVEQCMFCHTVVDQSPSAPRLSAEIEQLQGYWERQEPIDWARIHRLPDHSRFPHEAHVQAGLACATCHGEVAQMGQARQVRSLKMGDCVACHQETGAPAQCGACHY